MCQGPSPDSTFSRTSTPLSPTVILQPDSSESQQSGCSGSCLSSSARADRIPSTVGLFSTPPHRLCRSVDAMPCSGVCQVPSCLALRSRQNPLAPPRHARSSAGAGCRCGSTSAARGRCRAGAAPWRGSRARRRGSRPPSSRCRRSRRRRCRASGRRRRARREKPYWLWSRPVPTTSAADCVNGVRPNSVVKSTSVSSSMPRWRRSLSRPATGWSMRAASWVWFSFTSSWPSQLMRGLPNEPPEKSCTNRTPCSSSRRASRQLRPKSRGLGLVECRRARASRRFRRRGRSRAARRAASWRPARRPASGRPGRCFRRLRLQMQRVQLAMQLAAGGFDVGGDRAGGEQVVDGRALCC